PRIRQGRIGNRHCRGVLGYTLLSLDVEWGCHGAEEPSGQGRHRQVVEIPPVPPAIRLPAAMPARGRDNVPAVTAHIKSGPEVPRPRRNPGADARVPEVDVDAPAPRQCPHRLRKSAVSPNQILEAFLASILRV